MDGRLDTRQQERHRFQSRNQQNHRQRRILRRHRLHRLHFLVRQRLIDSAPYFDHTLLANAYKDEAIRRGNGALTPMRERKTSKHGNRGASPNSTTLCISRFSSPTLVTTETITRKSKSPKPRHLGKAHGRKASAKFTCATTFTRTYCIRPILESTGPTAQRADNKWTGIQLERVDCSFMQNVPLSAPLYRLDMLCTCRGASGESGS